MTDLAVGFLLPAAAAAARTYRTDAHIALGWMEVWGAGAQLDCCSRLIFWFIWLDCVTRRCCDLAVEVIRHREWIFKYKITLVVHQLLSQTIL